jgi:6-phosphogluconolactonase
VLNAARNVIFVCVGEGKKQAIHEMADKGVDYPSGRVAPTTGKLYWLVDEAAAALTQAQISPFKL